ncbi:MAG TPA: glycosyltransferase family 4 protein [Vicinamibacterales bacterium]|nr:glycosyltransferase family 4 protein [Vicinamibacterales bacterium]
MRVLMVQRSLEPPGGGNAVAAWMVHALAGRHHVDTLTAREWTAASTNAFYGTAIPERGITKHVTPAPWSWLASLPEDRLTRLRMCSVLRYARPMADRYDLLVTADNYGAFPKSGMQYLHFPAPLNPEPARLRAIVTVYFALCDWFVGVAWSRAERNVTLANSAWTAGGLAEAHVITVGHVLYPPVVDPGEGRPWDARHDTFLCLGRFHGSKRIELSMAIVRRLRAGAIPDARLVVVGSPVDAEYAARIKALAAPERDWIEFREDLSRAEVNRLIGESRYGMQAMEDEHFGMATAEMARGGCLVFPHHSGGSPEVVGGEAALLWRTEDEAVARITALVRDPRQREAVRSRLRAHAATFATERFVERFLGIVDAWAEATRSGELAKPGVP